MVVIVTASTQLRSLGRITLRNLEGKKELDRFKFIGTPKTPMSLVYIARIGHAHLSLICCFSASAQCSGHVRPAVGVDFILDAGWLAGWLAGSLLHCKSGNFSVVFFAAIAVCWMLLLLVDDAALPNAISSSLLLDLDIILQGKKEIGHVEIPIAWQKAIESICGLDSIYRSIF